MNATYFGLICSTCNSGFPLGENSPLIPAVATTDHTLHCPKCKTSVIYQGLRHWTMDAPYTEGEIAEAARCVRSVTKEERESSI